MTAVGRHPIYVLVGPIGGYFAKLIDSGRTEMTGRQWWRMMSAMALAAGLAASITGPKALGWDQGARQKGQEIAASDDKDRPAAPPDASPAPGELAREGLAKMLQALDKLIQSIPQYEMPSVDENGDIILRRKRPEAPVTPAPAPAPNQPDRRGI